MTIKEMQYIIEIAKCKNFTKAAESLYISQPALSQAIIRLEKDIGIQIFTRRKNSVELTPEGTAIYNKACQVFNEYNEFCQLIEKISKDKKTAVSLGITPYYSSFYLPMITSHLKKTHPEIKLDIVEDVAKTLRTMILHEHIDLGIFVERSDDKDIVYDLLYREEIFLAVPSDYMLRSIDITKPVDISLFRDAPFVLMKNKNTFNELCQKICADAGFTPKVVYNFSNWETACAMIAQGAGIGFLPRISIFSLPKKNTPIFLKINTKHNTRNFSVARLASRPVTNQMRAVINSLVGLFSSFDPNSLD